MTDFAAVRRHMVDGQLRTADVTDLRVLDAMLDVERERFVPPAAVPIAYLDQDVVLGEGRCLLKPMVFAKLIQAANIALTDHVLDIGCATGYGAAVLAHIAGSVVALEQDDNLAKTAASALAGIPNVTLANGQLADGWTKAAPYDAIVLEGATEVAPHALCNQLKDGGRLVCVLGAGPGSKATLYSRSGDDLGVRPLFNASAPLLPGFAQKPVFAF
jgi:protein-L-isoaspartate(D-aspartate) O-methyltransferase